MKEVFQKLHKDGKLEKIPRIVRNLHMHLQEIFIELPLDWIKSFAKQRIVKIIVRMRYLNTKHLDNQRNNQKRKQQYNSKMTTYRSACVVIIILLLFYEKFIEVKITIQLKTDMLNR